MYQSRDSVSREKDLRELVDARVDSRVRELLRGGVLRSDVAPRSLPPSKLSGSGAVSGDGLVWDGSVYEPVGLIPSSLLTTRGDLIRRGASAPERVALGASGSLLSSNGTDAVWAPLPTYTAPTFAGTWAHYGSTIRDVGYTLLPGGVVMLNGSAKRTGTTGLTLFTLPAGYRPLETLIFPVVTSAVAAGFARLDVNADGTVVLQVADPGIAIVFTALDGISFLAGV